MSSDRKPTGGRRANNHQLLRKRFGMEPKILKDFQDVLASDLGKIGKWEMIQEEQHLVWKLLRSAGTMEGAAAVAFTFFGLNRLPRILARRHAASKKQASYMLEKPVKQPPSSPFAAPKTDAVEKQVKRTRTRILFTVMELTFDIGMSLGVGASVAMLASDEKEAQRIFLDVPLQPGRSFLSDTICDNLLQEYRRQWEKDGDHQEVLREPHHRSLQLVKGLAQNCRHRQVMEAQLRLEQGVPTSSKAHLPIPDTGVIPMSEDPLWTMTREPDNEEIEASAVANVASWVKDQEER